MKIKISIVGKTTVETPLLKGTNYALIKDNELHCNPDGYEGEVKIIELKNSLSAPDAFWNIRVCGWMPENTFAVLPGKWSFKPLWP